MTVRVRFAPSPTGYPHIGNLRTVVFNWLFARHHGGKFILRIEDTDRSRYVRDSLRVITDSLTWLGMDWDEGPGVGGDYGPYIQSERLELYRQKAEELIAKGWAYRCNCTPERLEKVRAEQRAQGKSQIMYDRHCRNKPPDEISPDEPHVIRLKVPLEGKTVVHDLLRGDIEFDNALLDDQILLKSDGYPTYHLAVVVDDHMMGITHVMRGDDWISSTPKRVLLYQAFGWEPPIYAHVPLVLGPDGKKLSKRHGAVSIDEFRRQGYLPEALFNFLALLGWSPGDGDREIYSREELIAKFDIRRINLAAAVFSYDKLKWMNGAYIRALDEQELLKRLIPFWQDAGMIPTPVPTEMIATLETLVPLVRERLKTLRDVVELTDFVFKDIETPSAEALIPKKTTAKQALRILQQVHTLLAGLVYFNEESLETSLRQLAADMGVKAGAVFNIIRVATTNKRVAPPLFGSLVALGRTTTLQRLARAEEVLASYLEQTGA